MNPAQKEELIKEIDRERQKFAHRHMDTTDHEKTIHYLKTGEFSHIDTLAFEILEAAVNDIDCLYSDYCN